MKTFQITNDIFLLTFFDLSLLSNKKGGGEFMSLRSAPTTEGHVVFYLSFADDDPEPLCLCAANSDEWVWSKDAFGLSGLTEFQTLEFLELIEGWDSSINYDDSKMQEFWQAAEEFRAVRGGK